MPRKYELRRRAERQQETRQRIVEAAVALHEEQGVLRTTILDIAARAGVERATVYRHFPDDGVLLTACIGHYFALHPPTDPDPWRATDDPEARLRTGLTEIYAYHRETEPMISRTSRDVPDLPHVQEILVPVMAHWARVGDVLAGPWVMSEKRHALIAAGIGHAIAFSTWHSLVREQALDDGQAVEVMVAMVRGLAATPLAGENAITRIAPSAD